MVILYFFDIWQRHPVTLPPCEVILWHLYTWQWQDLEPNQTNHRQNLEPNQTSRTFQGLSHPGRSFLVFPLNCKRCAAQFWAGWSHFQAMRPHGEPIHAETVLSEKGPIGLPPSMSPTTVYVLAFDPQTKLLFGKFRFRRGAIWNCPAK